MLPALASPAIPALAGAHPLPTRQTIDRLQRSMIPMATATPEPVHIFHDGWYERRLLVPAGMLIVGKIHRHAHPVGVIRGHAWIVSEFGRQEVRAGFLDVSPAGVKRVVLAVEDTLFFTLHRNEDNGQDLAAIEAAHIEPEADFLAALASARREVLQ